ncbi:hypothetical protein BBJ29_008943 [Phytophthora kernoviae]|uniref:Expansin-like EG45 domain-containing protein n=1 Tax=Phytophthora kernoviae TaxID=325452 RepID=A0A3F2RFG9_9STRA|nr:hypothetical protein BBJ29_008943 [Phytophthora kernoviae]RLN55624.1 hypothetical protein BBP00_00008413 [Phytophthora kernoviae]
MYAALNADQWDDTMNCGRCAEVWCTDASCSGRSSEIVYILDQCPGCSHGDLDLSPAVFKSVMGQSPSKLSIAWKFVDCPVSNNVQYCLKSGSSEFWVAIQPANFASGVESLKINGQKTSMVDSAYYFLIDGSVCGCALAAIVLALYVCRRKTQIDDRKYPEELLTPVSATAQAPFAAFLPLSKMAAIVPISCNQRWRSCSRNASTDSDFLGLMPTSTSVVAEVGIVMLEEVAYEGDSENQLVETISSPHNLVLPREYAAQEPAWRIERQNNAKSMERRRAIGF